ncbi:hypothetical protein Ancab_021918 [Ancistrocladus abbreviatus]
MAILPASFSMASCCLNCGVKESLKMVSSSCYILGKRLPNGEDKLDMQSKILFGDRAQQAAECSSGKLSFKARAMSSIPVDQAEKKSSRYMFRTENGDQVKVAVGKKNIKYLVNIEVSSSEVGIAEDKLVLCWGIYKSDSSSFIPLDFQNSFPKSRNAVSEAPFTLNSFGTYGLEMEFESYLAPFYLSFLLKYPFTGDSNVSDIKSNRGTNFCVPVGLGSGSPSPLGLSFSFDGSVNFALFSRHARSVVLCLYDDKKSEKPALEIELDAYVNRTGDIWHASLDSQGPFMRYGYRCNGPGVHGRENNIFREVLLDPYAKIIGKSIPGLLGLGELQASPAFSWSGEVSPSLPMENLVVYRLNVSHFTKDISSKLPADIAGTFLGVAEKLQHFKDLGVNAILLEPVFTFDEEKGPYFPFHFFSPINSYGPLKSSISAIKSMKEMVKRMHVNGIEVFLEVVFTHTAEGGALQEIDYSSYCCANGIGHQGSGNALNCNYPIVQQFILNSLRYWVTEFHIDGFCFMNASYLLRGFHGEHLSRPPLVEAIAFDPLLSKTKIIADNWDPRDLGSKSINFPHWKRWAEVNSNFCNDVRNFLRGEGLLSNLATRLCGSGDRFFDGRGPSFSFNFIARNFGLPLVDLVSFSKNELASELSWNCGEEGPTSKKVVLERRLKQIRNYLFILFISLGVPVLNMGDECGLSSGGSPAYGDRKPLNWNAVTTSFGIQTTQFASFLSSLRKRHSDLFERRNFWRQEMINWHGNDLSPPRWDDPSAKFLSMTLKAETTEIPQRGELYIAFNASGHSENILLPTPPEEMSWMRLVDTALPYPGFFMADGEPIVEQMPGLVTYEMKSYSCVLFEAQMPRS